MSVAARLAEWLPLLWFILAVVLLVALWQSGVLNKLFDRMTKFGGFGLSFEFTEASARKTRDTVEKDLGAIRSAIQRQLAAAVRTEGLQEAFQKITQQVLDVIHEGSDARPGGCHATIHIPDPMFENQLYQLLDYAPKGGGSGRAFSSRSGIIGVAWRTQERDMWHQHRDISKRELVRQWGMTSEEANERRSTDRSKLFLAVPLTRKEVPIGVFYFDAASRGDLNLAELPEFEHLTDEQKAAAQVEADAKLLQVESEFLTRFLTTEMVESLAELVKDAKRLGPQIDLEGQ